MHSFMILFKSWNRTTRRMSGIRIDTVEATSRFGALRTWWRVQREWQPLVEVIELRASHTRACLDPASYGNRYACAHPYEPGQRYQFILH
jgi:hypothetical protein